MSPGIRMLVAAGALVLLVSPVAAQETDGSHQVRRGDTLWDLAGRYLADPFRWPEIYDLNPGVVEDPHWIYPGEILRLPGAGDRGTAAGVPMAAAQEAHRRETRDPGEYPEQSVFRQDPRAEAYGSLSVAEKEARPAVSASDFYSASIIADRLSLAVDGTTERVVVENPLELNLPPAARPYDEVVIHLSTLGVEVGDDLQAVRWGRSLGTAGSVLHAMAHLRVTRTYGDSARAEVVRIFADYAVGDPVIAAEEYALEPGIGPEPENAGLVGHVIGFDVDQILVGTGERVFLDLGRAAGVKVGDEFAVFSAAEQDPATARPADRLATLRVIRATDLTSTAMVFQLNDPGMSPGTPVRRVRRMP